MGFLKFFYLFTLLLGGMNNQNNLGVSGNFDFIVFSQHWPQTVCYIFKEKNHTSSCYFPKEEVWTIHGVWPSVFHGRHPQYCHTDIKFDKNDLKPLEPQLKNKWIDIERGTESYSFWEYEWHKHGTCAASIPSMNTTQKYFKKGLDLLNKYEFTRILSKDKIVPGNAYAVEDIQNAVKKYLNVNAEIVCAYNKQTNTYYLFEIRLCLLKDFSLINCSSANQNLLKSCGQKMLFYPSKVPSNTTRNGNIYTNEIYY